MMSQHAALAVSSSIADDECNSSSTPDTGTVTPASSRTNSPTPVSNTEALSISCDEGWTGVSGSSSADTAHGRAPSNDASVPTPITPDHRPKQIINLTPLASNVNVESKLSSPSPAGAAPASPVLLRPPRIKSRKKSMEQAKHLLESTAVQRLVEYFVVVSSKPRWEGGSIVNTSSNGTRQNISVATIPQQTESPQSALPSSPPSTPRGQDPCTPPLKSRVRVRQCRDSKHREDNGNEKENPSDSDEEDGGCSCVSDYDHVTLGSREAISPPTPRSEWTREETEDGAENSTAATTADARTAKGFEHTFQPEITARYPPMDHADNPLNPMIVNFCYPSGDVIVPSKIYELPRVHHFVLTNGKGRKVYGTCLTVLEEYHPSKKNPWRSDQIHGDDGERDIEVTVGKSQTVLYIPKVLCLLSTWPYLTAFREYLSQLFRLATTTNIMQTPIERYIINICTEIPAPPPGAYEVQLSILDSTIRFWAPPAKLPIAYVALPYGTLFNCLDIENILLLWSALIMEHKIVLVSSQCSLLTICAEILCSLLFPMRWCHLYVPLLPRFLCPMLDAPVPYLCGVTRENWLYAQQCISTETIVVDLDRNTVAFGEATPALTPAPSRKWSKLKASVGQAAGHLFWRARGIEEEYRNLNSKHRKPPSRRILARMQRKGDKNWNEKLQSYDQAFNLAYTPDSSNLLTDKLLEDEQSQWDQVQEAFLSFFVALLKDYRRFFHTPNASISGSFDSQSFVAAQKHENQNFLYELTMTQHFDVYITKRLYSPGEPDVIFFDQSIDAKLNRSRLKLKKVDTAFLHSAKAHKVLKTFQAIQPHADDLTASGTAYVYKIWPENFNNQLYYRPRPIPKMIAAEFDRQEVLVSRLRAQISNNNDRERENAEVDVFEFYGNDCNDSPEGAAFTVFFFIYSMLIGRDWLEYQKKRREVERQQILSNKQDSDLKEWEGEGAAVSYSPEVIVHYDSYEIGKEEYRLVDFCNKCPEDGFSALQSTLHDFVAPHVGGILSMQQINAGQRNTQLPRNVISQTPILNREMSLIDFEDSYYAEFEEARAVAVAQLDLGFETLRTMEMRGLSTDIDAYKSLMDACGRCGDRHRALELIELMKRDGLSADGEVLSCFIAAFAHQDVLQSSNQYCSNGGSSDAYYSYLKRKLDMYELYSVDSVSSSCGEDSSKSDTDSSEKNDSIYGSAIYDWFTATSTQNGDAKKPKCELKRKSSRRKGRKRKNSKRRGYLKQLSSLSIGKSDMLVTDAIEKQNILAESLLKFLYPGLSIDTDSDSCPLCSYSIVESDVVQGWLPCAFQDYTTCCPKCKHRFVPRFTVTCMKPDFLGSQGQGTPLYCEFLSPWVLRKELCRYVTNKTGIDEMLNPEWRSGSDIRGTLWWNMIILCQRYKLPFSFLLQGSFQNRLINPMPEYA